MHMPACSHVHSCNIFYPKYPEGVPLLIPYVSRQRIPTFWISYFRLENHTRVQILDRATMPRSTDKHGAMWKFNKTALDFKYACMYNLRTCDCENCYICMHADHDNVK